MRTLMVDFSPMADLNNQDGQLLIIKGAKKAIITHTIPPKVRQCSCQGRAKLSWIYYFAQFITQKFSDTFLNFFIKFSKLFIRLKRKMDSPFFSHQGYIFSQFLPKRWFFYPFFDAFPKQQQRENNLLDLPKIALQLVEYKNFWSDESLEQAESIVVQALLGNEQKWPWCNLLSFNLYHKYFKKYKYYAFLVSFCFLSSSSYAKDLGVYGETFPIIEENLLEIIQQKLKVMQQKGEIATHQQLLAQKARDRIRYPSAVPNVVKTIHPRQWLYDPSLKVDRDIKDAQGKIIAAQGTIFNPIDTLPWGAPLLFLDGTDPDQVAWAQRQDAQAKWILVKGSPLDLEEKLQRPIYFDQAGRLVKKFGLQYVPGRVSQQGHRLLVEELVLKEHTHD